MTISRDYIKATDQRSIEIVGWEKFQHYKDRTPKWIKNYIDLLDRDDYLDLTPSTRALLHGLWLYAARAQDVRSLRASSVQRVLKMRATSAQLESLNHAGFIELSAPPCVPEFPKGAIPERETEEEQPSEGPKGPSLRLVENERPPAVDGFTRLGDELDALIAEQRRTG